MNYCVDCKWFGRDAERHAGCVVDDTWCAAPQNRTEVETESMVYGIRRAVEIITLEASDCRDDDAKCGRDAKWFERSPQARIARHGVA